ncbi:Glutamate-5-semialdehyde dehydrogenase [Cordyceps fumosorosea ARSEF 2679]|uniref:glutamate-5-semialdehyde dehydrogenase n=1 Tax=Cordyceps fumosorosea (strain ARSEF 2679) TaxID=1081104 RepID=A0A167NCL2_CORFA|nr:Glutamate-5-semialdehyde dehydrogenase [Cordyceps fumosorosea ARSEF 2679]OAA55398.1 Glutamate-5-semialdehyde dehydrogenase [Cordyceps fumosorosea ARSEF 2679]
MSLTNASPEAAAREAKAASFTLAALPAAARNEALEAIHAALQAAADGSLSAALVSRLDLGRPGKWEDMLKGILDVRDLPDPLGAVSMRTKLDDDLVMERVSCPIGVLLIIFEARPEVIANIASLAIKSGNAAILKGGKESTESFVAIAQVISAALDTTKVPNGAIQLVTTRDAIASLLAQDRSIDLVIPRGSNELVRHIKENTKIPVLGHADGLCSIYLTATADAAKAATAIVDAKTSYPAACNSVETLLVQDTALATTFPAVAAALVAAGVELRCDAPSKAAALTSPGSAGKVVDAVDADYDTEHLSLTLAVRTVTSVDEAVAHINAHGSGHTESIMTADAAEAERFMDGVDAAGAYWNASTRLADGMRYGFGTEVGISTNKIHARGPVGLEGLTIYKYKIRGDYQATAGYGEGEGQRRFKHEKMAV